METKLSIIIQSYERPLFLEGCLAKLETLLIPNLKDIKFEIIIADDGSKNKRIFEVINNFKFDKKCYFNTNKKEKGPGHTLNKANEMITGNYVLHIEDDFWLNTFLTENHIYFMIQLFNKIENLELIRIRSLYDKIGGIKYRLNEFNEKTEPEVFSFGNDEFRIFKKWRSGGPNYQYTGNAHIRKNSTLEKMGFYTEKGNMISVENNAAIKFNKNQFRSGTFKNGWFYHMGFGQSTRSI